MTACLTMVRLPECSRGTNAWWSRCWRGSSPAGRRRGGIGALLPERRRRRIGEADARCEGIATLDDLDHVPEFFSRINWRMDLRDDAEGIGSAAAVLAASTEMSSTSGALITHSSSGAEAGRGGGALAFGRSSTSVGLCMRNDLDSRNGPGPAVLQGRSVKSIAPPDFFRPLRVARRARRVYRTARMALRITPNAFVERGFTAALGLGLGLGVGIVGAAAPART